MCDFVTCCRQLISFGFSIYFIPQKETQFHISKRLTGREQSLPGMRMEMGLRALLENFNASNQSYSIYWRKKSLGLIFYLCLREGCQMRCWHKVCKENTDLSCSWGEEGPTWTLNMDKYSETFYLDSNGPELVWLCEATDIRARGRPL